MAAILAQYVHIIAMAHVSPGLLQGAVVLTAKVFSACILQVGDWTSAFTPASHYFSTYITTTDMHQDSVQLAVLGLNE